ncbi:methyltransferase [Haliangium ochraceum]|uniref:methyltransferase n=1 Tax=Haliangium ochraceum TaxID=80816 RepID=UPI0018F01CB0|nr:methyltransferase [Haliangium ochraceum]
MFERLVMRRPVEDFYRILGGYTFFQLLSSAVELELFTLLAERGPLTQTELAEALDIELLPLRVLLLGCVTQGLLKKKRDRYRNSYIAQTYLSRSSEKNIISMVRWQNHINYRPMGAMYESLRANENRGLACIEGEGDTLFERLAFNQELEAIFFRAMDEQAENISALLVEHVEFAHFKEVVDVGGGTGVYLIKLAHQYPQLRGTVFDLPSVCELARQRIADAGLSERLQVSPGDCFASEFPAGTDCFLFAHFLTLWSAERNRYLLARAYEGLRPGGAVVLYSIMQDDDEAGPLSASIGSAYFLNLATGQSMLYSWREYISWLREAGFETIYKRRVLRDHGIIVAVKG